MSKRDHLRSYLRDAVRDLLARRVVRPTDSIDTIANAVVAEFARDVAVDIKVVLGEFGAGLMEAGIRTAAQAGGVMLQGIADDLVRSLFGGKGASR